ncbi:hypothetical protein [Bradyrhizobium elkanii]|uniref:hypothetical protein n=1 Tax=Bradyrhizobium elkanii TaxID=29448 RepID=UPI0004AD52B1|nr:hypothetical protein [Bradyrhizobium elkanii]WLA84858.1 hypothetical protein QNJ99_11770 [Bradyrhizobium elkanii]
MTLSGLERRAGERSRPFDREQLVAIEAGEFLVHDRLETGGPVVLFLPGGAHLARVAYGHPGARREDFLDHHLEACGLALLAISYPTSHPVFSRPDPLMTLSRWAAGVAEITANMVGRRPVLVAGWSMAGKGVLRLNGALMERGVPVTGFVSLCARPPWPGLSPRLAQGEPVRADGLWDSSLYHDSTIAGLEEVNRLAGRTIISAETHSIHYHGEGPLMLRGEVDRLGVDGRFTSTEAALADSQAFAFEQAPLCATISPTASSDAEHALADAAIWSAIGLMGLLRNHLAGADLNRLPCESWTRLRALAGEWPRGMNRTVDGGHFFFVGETGAGATARALADLNRQLAALKDVLQAIRDGVPPRPAEGSHR